MSKHSVFKEIFNYPSEDVWALKEVIDMFAEARDAFESVGVPFSYDGFVKYAHRRIDPIIQDASMDSRYQERYKRQLSIIDGDNLDLIEEKAKENKLI